jgi:CRP-like cAMP-binding protein
MSQAVFKRSFDLLSSLWPERAAPPPRAASPYRRKDDQALSLVPSRSARPDATGVESALRRQDHAAAVLREHGHGRMISGEHAEQIAGLLRTCVLQTNDDVLESVGGADRGMLLVILRGEVRAELQRKPHAPLFWGLLGPGQWLGELPESMGGPSNTSMSHYANSNVEVGVLPLTSIQHLLLDRPALAASLLLIVSHQLGRRLRDTQERALLQHQWMSTVASSSRSDSVYGELDIELG